MYTHGYSFRSGLEIENVIYFRVQGYILVRKLFDDKEMKLIWECFNTDHFRSSMFTRSDGGQQSKPKLLNISSSYFSSLGSGAAGFQMSLWWRPGDDTVGLLTRSRKIVTTMQELLGGPEIYVLSSKLVAKEPEVGGPFAWHQVELN